MFAVHGAEDIRVLVAFELRHDLRVRFRKGLLEGAQSHPLRVLSGDSTCGVAGLDGHYEGGHPVPGERPLQ